MLPGQLVYLRVQPNPKYPNPKLHPLYEGPFSVKRCRDSNVTLLVRNKERTVHLNRVKHAQFQPVNDSHTLRPVADPAPAAPDPILYESSYAGTPSVHATPARPTGARPKQPAQLPRPLTPVSDPEPEPEPDSEPDDVSEYEDADNSLLFSAADVQFLHDVEASTSADVSADVTRYPESELPPTPSRLYPPNLEISTESEASPEQARYVAPESVDVSMFDLEKSQRKESEKSDRRSLPNPAPADSPATRKQKFHLFKDALLSVTGGAKRKPTSPPAVTQDAKRSAETTLSEELLRPRSTRSQYPDLVVNPHVPHVPLEYQKKKKKPPDKDDKS